jgi:hypothetical protein
MADLNMMATKIKDALANVEGVKSAFDHEPQTLNQLPAATLYFDGFSQVDYATRRKSVNWRWVVRMYLPLSSSDVARPQMDIRNIVENTIKQLRTDPSLGGSCLYHTISDGDVSVLLEQANPMMVAELSLTATTEEDF